MSEPFVSSAPPVDHAGTERWQERLAVVVLLIIVVVLIVASMIWMQQAGHIGIEQGYPKPTVHIVPLSQSTLRLHQSTQFSVQGSGRDLKYSWDFGDQQATGDMQGQSVSYAYESNGSHTITVNVVDGIGQSSSDSYTVNVLPPPPVANFTVQHSLSYFGDYDAVTFDLSGSSADPSTTIQDYSFDYGDGQSDDIGAYYYFQPTHDYTASGTYKVTLTVTDGFNQQATYSQNVVVDLQATPSQ